MPAGTAMPPRHAVKAFVFTVAVVTGLVDAAIAVGTARAGDWHVSAAAWVLAAIALLPDRSPVVSPTGDSALKHYVGRYTFTIALTLVGPLGLAIAATALGDIVSRDWTERRPLRALFNVSQQSLSLALCGLVYALASGQNLFTSHGQLDGRVLPAALAAAATYWLTNHALVSAVIALDQRIALRESLRGGVSFALATSGILYVFAPAVAAAVQISPWLVIPVMAPVVAVRRGASVAADRERAALHDPLTGLPNRALLRDRMQRLLLDPGRASAPLGLLLMDLDHFKDINDTLGHHIGDLLLRDVGQRMHSVIREGDTVARLGGDEFAVLLGGLESGDGAALVAERLSSVMREPFQVAGVMLDVGVSTGIAFSPDHGTDIDILLQRADVALYAAKETRGCWSVYRPEADSNSVERLALLGELRIAIETGQLVVHYQPKADAHSAEIIGVDSLVRWNQPSHGLLPPDRFISLAESTGLISELTIDVLRRSLAQVASWRTTGLDLNVAVNISARLLTDLSLPLDVAALLRDFGLPSSALTLEVTESMILADPTRTLSVLHGLAEVGVGLSIDDFGTGYSSLSYLRRLQADELKIDKSFVMSMATSSNDAVIVRSTIELARSLGLRTVGEGVEDEATWHLLRNLGCDQIQGFHLARPMPGDQVGHWLASYRKRLTATQGA